MRTWPHSGFSVDNSVYLPPHDTAGLERLAQYILRRPFSLARVVRLTDGGSVIYRALTTTIAAASPARPARICEVVLDATSRFSARCTSWSK